MEFAVVSLQFHLLPTLCSAPGAAEEDMARSQMGSEFMDPDLGPGTFGRWTL